MSTAALIALTATGTVGLAIAVHALRWREGRAAVVSLSGIADLPRRYFVHVHGVVARERFSAPMHVSVASGFGLFGVAVLAGMLVPGAPLWLLPLALALIVAGASLNVARRRILPSRRHASGGVWPLLPGLAALVVAAMAGVFLLVAAPWWLSVTLLAASLVALGWLMAVGPLRHAVAGVVNLAAHPRPGRFAGNGIDAGLAAPALDHDPGIAGRDDLSWTRLAQFDACVQCGRCEAACPAFAAGQPLNPKRLVFDLASGGWNAPAYSGAPHPAPVQPGWEAGLAAGLPVEPATLWACTTCRACVDACPMFIEHVDTVIDLRRAAVLRHGALPPAAADALDQVRANDNRFGASASMRTVWASGLAVRVLAPGERADVLLWTGDAAFEARGQAVLRATAELLTRAGIDVAILGEEEPDCGDLARRLGDEVLAARQIARVREMLAARGIGRLLTIDPHVANAFRHDAPEIAARWPVHHHAAYFAELIASGRLALGPSAMTVAVHDPCYVSRYLGEADALRDVLRAAGAVIREPEYHGRRSRCCGFGGGAALADVPGRVRISEQRADELAATGAGHVAVACPNCTVMLSGASAAALPVLDIAEVLLAGLGGRAAA